MPSWEKQACQKIAISRAIIFIVLLVGLLILVVVYLSVSWQGVIGESSTQDVTYDPTDNSLGDDTFEGCKSRATVVTDEDIMQRWDTCSRTFTQAWSNAKQNMRAFQAVENPTSENVDGTLRNLTTYSA
ncbi:uncharacterized protein LOC125000997 isoform X3 [Mugil cephalus]|uniref:uncharacterized protein LOC125000997 isoform X3 n=1 Tax=Mugil cephalus TaxID=48193 RepID=UPI001FB5A32D|nr:uncharacterized protein LOC125000997 isoform X3 [Mugil cephalus]